MDFPLACSFILCLHTKWAFTLRMRVGMKCKDRPEFSGDRKRKVRWKTEGRGTGLTRPEMPNPDFPELQPWRHRVRPNISFL